MANCSSVVTPSSQSLHPLQSFALQLTAWGKGRDVVFAVDVTRSVRLNNQGRLRIEQIIRDSLQRGDTAYIVPFASDVQLTDSIAITTKDDIQKLLNQLPLQTDLNQRNTDIQKAELFVYQFLAQNNHCRLIENQGIREQAVVWLTDAPLATKTGQDWIETPAESPFLEANSNQSQLRKQWLEVLPLRARSRTIPTENNEQYQLTIVDIKPTVQEFCTPAPSGKETCFVNRYLLQQLWLPTTGLTLIILFGLGLLGLWYSWQKPWSLKIEIDGEEDDESAIKTLKSNQRLAIGDYDSAAVDYIECSGEEVRGYIERKRNKLYLIPTQNLPLFYQDQAVKRRIEITKKRFRLNCPQDQGKDFEFMIKVEK
ncbi:hypothetical protein PCC7418_3849 [Halothece sp. PCC 7418]|uniref:vWA domain-containing protein n=1 Tax=Halothece sp. (strain PCC 7418) TaxID=65093 RepID=UPI0002A088EB|nr:vWA domain-containing protein [Halothece sp. PCC 7418]AFZ45953.1 hypothetical protein PCC7418_3849 [Halothece sp. PCC 7418]